MKSNATTSLIEAALALVYTHPCDVERLLRKALTADDAPHVVRVPRIKDTDAALLPLSIKTVEYAMEWSWFTPQDVAEAVGAAGRPDRHVVRQALLRAGLTDEVVRTPHGTRRVWRRPGQPQSEYTGRPVPWTPPV